MTYHEYLQSSEWEVKRQAALDYAEHRCQLCNHDRGLEVHHRTYDNLFHEHPADLTVLCDDCHQRFSDRLAKEPYSYLARIGWLIEDVIYG